MKKYVKYNASFLVASLEHLGLSWHFCYQIHVHNFKIIYTLYSGNRDVVNLTSDGDYILHERMNDWKDINESDPNSYGNCQEITNWQILVEKCTN